LSGAAQARRGPAPRQAGAVPAAAVCNPTSGELQQRPFRQVSINPFVWLAKPIQY